MRMASQNAVGNSTLTRGAEVGVGGVRGSVGASVEHAGRLAAAAAAGDQRGVGFVTATSYTQSVESFVPAAGG